MDLIQTQTHSHTKCAVLNARIKQGKTPKKNEANEHMCPIENAFFYKDEQQQQQRVEKVIFKQTLPDIIKIVIIMIIMT